MLQKSKLKNIVIDIDSRAVKGYDPEKKGNNCYNILMAFCDELKAHITAFMCSPTQQTVLLKWYKEIIANLKDKVDNIVFRMDSGYFSEEIVKVIEGAGYQYAVKAKEYSNLLGKAYDTPVKNWVKCGCQSKITVK